jgi:hypothetical protein
MRAVLAGNPQVEVLAVAAQPTVLTPAQVAQVATDLSASTLGKEQI